jgi:quinol-cytochrome oxidoreductase complex cytochrome b subunit
VNQDLAIMVGFLLATCLLFAVVAWVAMNYVESDMERFQSWVHGLPER